MMNTAPSPAQVEELSEPAGQDSPQEEQAEQPQAGGDTGPLSRIEMEPAENGGAIVTHHMKVSDRVKHMGRHEPKRHVFESKKKAAEHVAKHIHRLK